MVTTTAILVTDAVPLANVSSADVQRFNAVLPHWTSRNVVTLNLVTVSELDACDVTLSVYPHRASLKNMPDQGGNRTYDLWNTSPMLCQLSYAVRSVRVCDISEQNLVPSISM